MKHTGLPKSISKSNKKKTISMNYSPMKSLDELKAESKLKPILQQSLLQSSRNINRIGSKQKPNRHLGQLSACKQQYKHNRESSRQYQQEQKYNMGQRVRIQQQNKKYSDSRFIKQVKEMLSGISNKKTQKIQMTQHKKEQRQTKRIIRLSPPPKSKKQPRRNNYQSKIQIAQNHIKHTISLVHRLWAKYQGETSPSNNTKEGYGILYFQNGDKYIGNFYNDYPEGHGTYYDNINQITIMGIWSKGQMSSSPVFSEISKIRSHRSLQKSLTQTKNK